MQVYNQSKRKKKKINTHILTQVYTAIIVPKKKLNVPNSAAFIAATLAAFRSLEASTSFEDKATGPEANFATFSWTSFELEGGFSAAVNGHDFESCPKIRPYNEY